MMKENEYIEMEVMGVSQNIGVFYIGKLTPKNLLLIANDSLSRMQNLNGIQRDKDPKKVKEITEYILEKDATFPNTIILAIQNDPSNIKSPDYILEEKGDKIKLKIKLDNAVANILDGQHRLAGFDVDDEKFELPVSIFLDLSLGDQAKIFAQINSNQKKVSNDLVYELFGITNSRSFQKTAYHIVKHLNEESDSAWYGLIKTLHTPGDLAQGSMAKYIHENLIKQGKILHKLYNEEKDTAIKNILKNYFNAVKNNFKEEWNEQSVLTKTTGFNGFSIFMIDLIKLSKNSKKELSTDYFEEYISKTRKDFEKFTSDSYESGARGQNKVRNILRSALTTEERDFLKIKS